MPRDQVTSVMTPWMSFAELWTRMSEQMTRSFVEANRATAAAFGLPTNGSSTEPGDAPPPTVETPVDGMAYRVPEWEFKGSAATAEELAIGTRVSFSKEVTDDDVRSFARASGDTNRLHLDEDFARDTRFGGRIVHGTLVAGLISAALARLPLVTVYLSQDLTFRQPVEIGDVVTAECEIIEDIGDGRYRLSTTVTNEANDVVVEGEAMVLIDDIPDDD